MKAEIQTPGEHKAVQKIVETMDIDPSNRILVVDDEHEIADILEFNLKHRGYEVLTAYTGSQALHEARTGCPDLILLDYMLPELSGPEVAAELKRNSDTADIPIIFLTARSDTESVVQGLGTGAVDYIKKPFNIVELMARVATQLELKGTLDRLKQTEAELKKAELARDKLFTIFVHDIRSPFHSLNGFIERLGTRYDDLSEEERRQTVETIRQISGSVQSLLSKLLQWNCLQHGLFQWRPERVNLGEAVHCVERLFLPRLEAKDLDLQVSIRDSVSVFVDRNMLEAILRNLLQNAIKFTSDSGRIQLRSKRIGNKEEITISDNGIGIREESLKRIFQVEYSQATVDLQGEKSTGLGLILCKEFVELNGGSIRVSSVFGAGTEFTFTLPRG